MDLKAKQEEGLEIDYSSEKNLKVFLKQEQAIDRQQKKRLQYFFMKAKISDALGPLENWMFRRRLNKYQPPHPPIFILGHWRSGTSFLQSLLGQAHGFLFFNKYQTIFPRSFLMTRKILKPLMNFALQQSKFVKSWKKGVTHNFDDLDTASEIEVALMSQFHPTNLHWGHIFPKNSKYYFDRYLFMENLSDKELRQWERAVRFLNKKVNFTAPNSSLIIKNPGSTAQVRHIRKIYPKSRFIFIHRNPYDVFYSNIKLWNRLMDNLALQQISEEDIKENILYIYRKMHLNYLEDKRHIPPGHLVEIPYQQLGQDPLKSMKVIFEELGLGDFDKNQAYFKEYLSEIHHQKSQYAYKRKDVEHINRDWKFMFDKYDYEIMSQMPKSKNQGKCS